MWDHQSDGICVVLSSGRIIFTPQKEREKWYLTKTYRSNERKSNSNKMKVNLSSELTDIIYRSLPCSSVTSSQWSLVCVSRMAGSRPMELDFSPPSLNSRYCVYSITAQTPAECSIIHFTIATRILRSFYLPGNATNTKHFWFFLKKNTTSLPCNVLIYLTVIINIKLCSIGQIWTHLFLYLSFVLPTL